MDLALNWLWQGSAIALAAASFVAVTDPSARVRYRIWAMAIALVLITPLVGFVRPLLFLPDAPSMPLPALAPVEKSSAFVELPDQWWTSSAVVIGIWAGWAVVHAARLFSAIAALWRARRRCQLLPRQVEPRLALWARLRVSGRQTQLALSNGVQSAAVLGGPSPIVALAPALVHELSADEIDCIVAHEWAHVQRRDDVAALLQAVVRVIAGWHPAVWWLDRRISAEREYACDEAVVQLTGSAKEYAACLVKVASLSMQPVRPLPVVAMSELGLRARVLRILSARTAEVSASRRGASLAAAAALSTLAVSIADVRLIEAASSAPPEQSVSEPTVAETPRFLGASPVVVSKNLSPAASAPEPESTEAGLASTTIVARAETLPLRQSAALRPATEPSQARMVEPAPVSTEPLQEVASRPLVPIGAVPLLREGLAASGAGASPAPALPQEATPWSAAADAGVALGRGSQKAAAATAGFFSRFGKKIASSF